MITVSDLAPRLGNQLFEIAAAIGLAKKLGTQVEIQDGWRYNGLLQNPFPVRTRAYQMFYSEPRFEYDPLPLTNNLSLHGMFQSEKYFSHCREEVLKAFTLRNEEDLKKRYDWENSCSIHVRRGDYLHHPHLFYFMKLDDYVKCIDYIGRDKHFYVFSDDIDWCRREFGDLDLNITYVPTGVDFEDMKMMGYCTHNICANSTFSWWGAYFNTNPNKMVTMPKRWFVPDREPGRCPTGFADDLYPDWCVRL